MEVHEFAGWIPPILARGEDAERTISEGSADLEVFRIASAQIPHPTAPTRLLHHLREHPNDEMSTDPRGDVEPVGDAARATVADVHTDAAQLPSGRLGEVRSTIRQSIESDRHDRLVPMIEGGHVDAFCREGGSLIAKDTNACEREVYEGLYPRRCPTTRR